MTGVTKSTMKFFASCNISCTSFSFSLEDTKVTKSIINSYVCFVSSISEVCSLACSMFVVGAVFSVLRMRCLAQIAPTIIKRVVVTMVDFARRVFARYPLPDQSMGSIKTSIQFDVDSGGTRTACWHTGEISVKNEMPFGSRKMMWRSCAPGQFAGPRVISEALAKIGSVGEKVHV